MRFSRRRKILFKDCDPAGRVFYPRYFEMLNDCVEEFFSDALGWPFEDIHPGAAVPTARIEATFPAPSRHGDTLEFGLWCTRIGTTSLSLAFAATSNGQLRLRASSTLVHVDGRGKPARWPERLRAALNPYLEEPDQ